jgi:CO dehydrogenase/acetyl-CoA synthase delta subunit
MNLSAIILSALVVSPIAFFALQDPPPEPPAVTFLVDDMPDVGFTCAAMSTRYDSQVHLTVHAIDCTADRIFQSGVEP